MGFTKTEIAPKTELFETQLVFFKQNFGQLIIANQFLNGVSDAAYAKLTNEHLKVHLKDGLNIDNLPQGFFIKNDPLHGKILCYSETLSKDEKTYLTLTLDDQRLKKNDPEFDVASILKIPKKSLNNKPETEKWTLALEAVIHAFNNTSSNYEVGPILEDTQYAKLLGSFSFEDLQKLGSLLRQGGKASVKAFLDQLSRLKENGLYHHFYTNFIQSSDNFMEFVTKDAKKAFDDLDKMNENQLNFWKTLVTQHCEENKYDKFEDLLNGFLYFCNETEKTIQKSKQNAPKSQLDENSSLPQVTDFNAFPPDFKFKDVSNMKIALDRALYMIKNAIYPDQQLKHLNDLSLALDNAYFAVRYNDQLFDLVRTSNESEEKFEKKYHPTFYIVSPKWGYQARN